MRRHRGLLSLLALVLLGGVGAASAYLVATVYLPQPHACSREQLLRWLVMRDLAREPRETRVALVDRLQREILDGGLLAEERSADLSPPLAQRVLANSEVLKEAWFVSRVEAYQNLPPQDQIVYLDRQIDTIEAWSTLENQLSADTSPPKQFAAPITPSGPAGAETFFNQMEHWIAQASGAQRHRMVRAVQVGLVRWLATRDLAAVSVANQQALAERIAAQLDAGVKLTDVLSLNRDEPTVLMQSNSRRLMGVWFRQRADEFAQLSAGDRPAFVDHHMDRVAGWGTLEVLSGNSAASDSSGCSLSAMIQWSGLIHEWVEQAPLDERPNVEALAVAVQQQGLLRFLQGR